MRGCSSEYQYHYARRFRESEKFLLTDYYEGAKYCRADLMVRYQDCILQILVDDRSY